MNKADKKHLVQHARMLFIHRQYKLHQVYDAIFELHPNLMESELMEIMGEAVNTMFIRPERDGFKINPPDRVTLVLSQRPGSRYLKAQIDHTRAVVELKQMDSGIMIWRFPVLRDDVERIIAEDLRDYHITRLPDIEEGKDGGFWDE